jgi:hypothetical protein
VQLCSAFTTVQLCSAFTTVQVCSAFTTVQVCCQCAAEQSPRDSGRQRKRRTEEGWAGGSRNRLGAATVEARAKAKPEQEQSKARTAGRASWRRRRAT